MNISDKGINLLKHLEGCVKNGNTHIIYDDKNGKPVDINKPLPMGATIGYGHLIKQNEDFRNGINEIEATNLLKQDIEFAERTIRQNIKTVLSQNQYDALVIFAFNIGEKNFAKSTVVKYINNPNFHSDKYDCLETAWKTWNKTQGKISKGLENRRLSEWKLFTA